MSFNFQFFSQFMANIGLYYNKFAISHAEQYFKTCQPQHLVRMGYLHCRPMLKTKFTYTRFDFCFLGLTFGQLW